MSDDANTLRSFRPSTETLEDVARIATAAVATEMAKPSPLDAYAPPRIRNKIAADMVPELTRDAVLKMFEDAAVNVERAMAALDQMVLERKAEAQETARTLRELGALQAASIERAAKFAYDQGLMFHTEAERCSAFRAETGPGAKAA